jgi:serine/threonine-protein kinase
MSQSLKHAGAVAAGDDANFAHTVVEELFVDSRQGDAEATGSPPDTLSAPGDSTLQAMPTLTQAGRYELKHQLGRGGLGTVYAALDPLLSRQVAVKMLQVGDLDAQQRSVLESQLLAEARAAAGLAHPNIVTVHDAGLAAEGVYIAMERLRGKDLRHMLAEGWRPDAVQAARIAKRLADALAYAHGKGVVHCDIKPANIFMVSRTQPKVLDFGIARVTRRPGAHGVDIDTGALHSAGAEGGSPYYISPEQLLGQALDERADVYGVGVVLYELLAGRRAFEGHDLDAIRQAVLSAAVTPAHEVNPAVDRALSDIVARAMARKPGERWRTARQLSQALRTWITEETNGLAHRGVPRASRWWVYAAGATLSVGVVASLWLLAPRQADPLPTPPQAAAPQPPAADNPVLAATDGAAPALAAAPAPSAPQVAAPEPVRKPRTPPARAAKKADVAPPVEAEAPPAAPAPQGQVQLAVSPWGQIEVDGRALGTTPPLSRLTLPAGPHHIVVRNGDFPAYSASITVNEDKPVVLRHRFE